MREAELELAKTTHPLEREVLAEIIADERRHAELAWDIVDWCAAVDPLAREAIRANMPCQP